MSSSQAVTPVKSSSLMRSSALVSMMTMLSRVLGFVRDVLFARYFGAEAGADAFLVAFKIPNFMRRLFAEGAFSQAFVPVLAGMQEKESHTRLQLFVARMAGNMFIVLSIITVLAVIFSPYVIRLFAPGFTVDSERFYLAQAMLKITFPYLALISLTALCGSVLNTFGYFGVPAFTPALLNVSIIAAAIYLAPHFNPPVVALSWGVLLGGILQLAFQIPFLIKKRLIVLPRINFKDKGVRRVLTLMVPALFGVSVAQINILLDTVFASFLPVGSVSWLFYSDRLTFFPLGVFAVAIATVILPRLSRQYVDNVEAYSKSLDWGIRGILLIAFPSTIGLVLFAKPILFAFLTYGKFSVYDVEMTAKSLRMFSLGLTGFMLVKVFASAFYATQNIKTPVKVGVIAMLVNTALCLALIWPLAHAGLALASSIAGLLNAVLLFRLLINGGIYKPSKGWRVYFAQLLFANTVLVLMLCLINHTIDWMTLTAFYRILCLLLSIVLAILTYVLCLGLSGLRLRHFK